MHDIYDPQTARRWHLDKTPGQRVHGWPGEIDDGTTNSLCPIHDRDARRSAEVTKHQLRGFMVPARGVHGGDKATVLTRAAPRELTAARSAVRSLAPLLRGTSGTPTAAARRPERRTLLGIAVPSPCLTWWGSYSNISLSQLTFDITGASLPRRSRLSGICPPHAPIMKVAARHEAESKIGEQVSCSRRRCRGPRWVLVPEVLSGSLRWAR